MTVVRRIRLIVYLLVALQLVWPVIPTIVATPHAQKKGRGGAQTGRSSSSVNRSSASRSGSTNQSAANRNRGSSTTKKSSGKAGTPATTGQRNSRGQRNVSRNTGHRSSHYGKRNRSRRVSRSRRHRRGGWHHHRCWHHRGWYQSRWVGVVFISVAVFAVIASTSSTYTYSSVTYYYYNPWYKKVLYEGEEGYILTTAPVGHKADTLAAGAETVEVDGATYYYADWSFWQAASGGGYVVVDPPVGAEVSAIPEEAISEKEGDVVLYQFDELYFTEDKNDAGKTVYRVEPSPPEEEIDEIPAGSPSFVADGETYHYVNFNFYVKYEENGKSGYTNGEPDIGAQVDKLPDGVTTIEEDGVTYYQFDSVFFEEVEGGDEETFYEVVGSPDGSDEEVQN